MRAIVRDRYGGPEVLQLQDVEEPVPGPGDVLAKGRKDGKDAQVRVELIDRFDEATGFTAMERTTGWDGALKAIMNAHERTPRGVTPAELAVSGPDYADELRKRGFDLSVTCPG